jgi:hypothetical protein
MIGVNDERPEDAESDTQHPQIQVRLEMWPCPCFSAARTGDEKPRMGAWT